jgi:hypothetical protein
VIFNIIHDRVSFLHRAYTEKPLSPCKRVPAYMVVQPIANKMVIRHGRTVNLSTSEKIIISFSHYREALETTNLGGGVDTLCTN